MKTSKAQLHRLIRLVGELKQNRYPNCSSFAKKLREADIDENLNLSCTPKTIQRDVKLLKEEYSAPIGYDSEHNGYYLKHHGWNFEAPLFSENDMVSLLIGAKLAEDITPDPLKSQIGESIAELLTTNNPDFLDTANIDSIIAATGLDVKINTKVFKVVFRCWKLHKTIEITHKTANGEISKRRIDPHVLSYYNKAWYVKAYCHSREDTRVFALHRIIEAEPIDTEFEFDKQMLDGVKGAPFKFEEIKNVKLWCSSKIAGYVMEKALADNKQLISKNADGSLVLTYPYISKLDLIKWVLSEGGNIEIIEPKELRKDLKIKAEKMAKIHQ